jgi:uncharacterized metal-binding protein YceD (DUF177 family)
MLLADIIEDELILALPIVPSHELSSCPAAAHVTGSAAESPAGNPADSEHNPFAALQELKKGKSDT